ncbi:TM2 domain-containing protein [Kiloniella majae]|uniref:NINE protein n=1 Tax=Kiloniella majae TaxID=1938558 RepID=UPI000A2797D1
MNKSLPIAYLLWLFTGVFGGHRWYLGKRWSALAMSVVGVFFIFLTIVLLDTRNGPFVIYTKLTWLLGLGVEGLINKFQRHDLLAIIIGTSYIVSGWLLPLVLFFDFFRIYFLIKKQPNTLTQQQVEAFD